MKTEELKKRLIKNRPMTSVTLRMPEDVVEDLKRVAPALGFSGYQPLIRAYVGQCLRKDLQRLDDGPLKTLIAALKEKGVNPVVLDAAIAELNAST